MSGFLWLRRKTRRASFSHTKSSFWGLIYNTSCPRELIIFHRIPSHLSQVFENWKSFGNVQFCSCLTWDAIFPCSSRRRLINFGVFSLLHTKEYLRLSACRRTFWSLIAYDLLVLREPDLNLPAVLRMHVWSPHCSVGWQTEKQKDGSLLGSTQPLVFDVK